MYRWKESKGNPLWIQQWKDISRHRAQADNIISKLTSSDPSLLHQASQEMNNLQSTLNAEYHIHQVTVTSLSIYKWDLYWAKRVVSTNQRADVPYSRHWNSVSNQRAFLDELARKLNITDQEGWYKVTTTMLKEYGGAGLLTKYSTQKKQSSSSASSPMINLLSTVYPEYHYRVLYVYC